jgi:hypothetical protein
VSATFDLTVRYAQRSGHLIGLLWLLVDAHDLGADPDAHG